MKFLPTSLPGVVVIEPDVLRDARGFFLETYHKKKFAEGGLDAVFVQDNHSRSSRGTLRGLHAQRVHAQGKLVRVLQGEIFDAAVDIRRGSPTFKKWVGVEISAGSFRQIYVPPGFAHGFCVVSETAEIEYKCTDLYHPEDEITVLWNDPEIGIEWPGQEPLLSNKDRAGRRLSELGELLPAWTGR